MRTIRAARGAQAAMDRGEPLPPPPPPSINPGLHRHNYNITFKTYRLMYLLTKYLFSSENAMHYLLFLSCSHSLLLLVGMVGLSLVLGLQ